MSARSSISGSDALTGFLVMLAAAAGLWLALFLGTTLLVDPYGISPVRTSLPGVNEIKPKRRDIDRVLKPVEVWQRAPRTLFLGTSRIHQGLDVSALEGSRFWPAYNASVPDGSIALNEGYLHHYARVNPRLDAVFMELFLYNFLIHVPEGPMPEQPPLPLSRFDLADLLGRARDLLFTTDTVAAAINTVLHNRETAMRGHEIAAGGHFLYPPGHNAQNQFSGFPAYIWTLHPAPPNVLGLNPRAFEKMQHMQALADARGISLAYILTPDHPIFDYYLEEVCAWDLVADWMTRVSAMAKVYAPAEPDHRILEPISPEMSYWYDPFHFTPEMGRAITDSLTGQGRFLVRLTPEMVPALIAARRQALRQWAAENPHWTGEMEREWQAHKAKRQ